MSRRPSPRPRPGPGWRRIGGIHGLRHAYATHQFEAGLPVHIGARLDTLMATDWVVYSKPCLTHTDTVVDYLARSATVSP